MIFFKIYVMILCEKHDSLHGSTPKGTQGHRPLTEL